MVSQNHTSIYYAIEIIKNLLINKRLSQEQIKEIKLSQRLLGAYRCTIDNQNIISVKIRNFRVIIKTFKALMQSKQSRLHCAKQLCFIKLFMDLIKMKDIEIKINSMICIADVSEHF